MEKISIGLLLLTVSHCYGYVAFTTRDIYATLNDRASLRCRSSEVVDIFFNGTKVVTGGKYTVTKRPTIDVTLAISSVALSDIGKYTCVSSTASSECNLRLQPFYPNEGKTFYKEIGKKGVIDFTILSVPRPDVSYLVKNPSGSYDNVAELDAFGTTIVGKDDYSIDANTGHLTINNIQAVHGGDWEVRSMQAGNTKVGNFKLVVGVTPSITSPPDASYDLVKGEAATIMCTFQTTPKVVEWNLLLKDGSKKVIAASDSDFTLDGTNLKINSVSESHEGASLTCIGKNEFGSANASTVINFVYVKPVIKALQDERVALGKKLNLTCEASGNPKPIVTWMRINDDNTTSNVVQTQTPGASVYVKSATDLVDAGSYKCEAVLKAKPGLKDSATVKVHILTPPVIDKAASTASISFVVGKGDTKDVVCVASGNPVPTISFMEGNNTLVSTDVTDGNKVTSTLKHSANATSDAGTLKCMAKNSVGSDSYDVTVNMIDKPAKPTGLKSSNVEKDSVQLSWDAVAGAAKYRVKQFGSVVITSMTASKTITGLDGGKTYQFAVAGENEAGVGEYTSFVSVTTEKFDKASSPVLKDTPTLKNPTVSWSKPATGSDDPTLKYEVEVCTVSDGKCEAKQTTSATSITLKLKENTDYKIKVTPTNSRGVGRTLEFQVKTGASIDVKPTSKAGPTDAATPEAKPKKGLSGAAIAGIIIAVILILLIVIDLFCCFFNECGFSHCCYQTCCTVKNKEGYAPGKTNDVEKQELKEVGDEHEVETKPEAEEKKEPLKGKKSEDV